ncbi:NADH:flavin oxidoreductase [Aquihabitans sp. McL0605]|uniref:oxidoreductase n=1 Tax=Aquihabitans sp. McL0605 TaxID=3415671 RepID=UPI003CEA0DD7
MRYPQVKKFTTVDQLRDRCAELGIDIPLADAVDAGGRLAEAVEVHDAGAGTLRIPNRFAILPMEGWDAGTDGRATNLVRRRWARFGASGAGLVWGEATAVRPDGRANPHQLVIDESTIDGIAALRTLLAPGQVTGLQLTHSGRWSRPDGAPLPRTAYAHPELDGRVGVGAEAVFATHELDELVEQYVAAAVLAAQAGFDFVDVKHCHGYLLHELLSARDRGDAYGGSLHGRTTFLRRVAAGIREQAPGLAIAVRLSVFDLMPFAPGPGSVGVPVVDGPYPYAFGGDGTGLGIDLAEPHALLDAIEALGIGLVCTTAGSPYYNPHVQRPAYFPPSDGYKLPEDPLVGVARQLTATAELTAAHPNLTVVGSGYSYLQQWLPHAARAVAEAGGASLIGLGRMALSHPDLPAEVLAGRPLDSRLICRTFSDCTTAPRNGLVSGCFPLDPFYKDHPQRVELAAVKKATRAPTP